MKYALTHCYTDHNKGDAAIIVSTTQLIRNSDSSAEINMFSTFGPNDSQFKNEHEFISKYADNMYPGMFYQPRPLFAGSDKSRVIHLLWIFIKFMLLLVTSNNIVQKILFNKLERQGIEVFLDSDVIISKGGSYITSQNTSVRQCISLFTMLYPFFLAKRYNKKMFIFSQSLGPVVGSLNQWLTKKALSGIEKIFLREDACLKNYSEVKALSDYVEMEIIPDTAFYLTSEVEQSKHDVKIKEDKFNVGLTLVDHAFKYISTQKEKCEKIENYKLSIVKNIEYLIENHDAYIHIFPQVISDNSHLGHSDVRISLEIEEICKNLGYGDRVKYHAGDYNPMQLKEMYKLMKIFIGTRLHSVIFSLSVNVPSINIAYHGTKSQGILSAIDGFEMNVIEIDSITPEILIGKTKSLLDNRKSLKNKLLVENVRLKSQLEQAIKYVVDASR
ncbi:MAG: colanic acid/amylovoran biosynthesis protein [Oleispira sp.]|jgi:colanic acid/amylovoran biosynthesis protein